VSLLSKLDIKPFFYSMGVAYVYEDGSVYAAAVLDVTQDDLLKKFFAGVTVITALSLRVGIPNIATLPHSIARAFQTMLAIALASDVTFKEAQPFKDYLADPAAYAAKHGLAAAAPAAAASAPAAGGKAEAAPVKEKEAEEEEEAGGFGGLFD